MIAKCISFIFIFILVVLVGVPSEAQKEKARHFYDAGIAAMEVKDFKKALEQFENAYEASPHWAVLGHIGHCRAQLDMPIEAIDAFEKFLEQGGANLDETSRKTAMDGIAAQKEKIGTLNLIVEPTTATVSLDGEPIGRPPFRAIVLRTGTHQIVVDRDGVKEVRNIQIVGNEKLHVQMYPEIKEVPKPPVTEKKQPSNEGELVVDSVTPGATVHIEGEFVGETPFKKKMPIGVYQLDVFKDGFRTYSDVVAIQNRMRHDYEIELLNDADVSRLTAPFWVATSFMVAGLATGGIGWGLYIHNSKSEANHQSSFDKGEEALGEDVSFSYDFNETSDYSCFDSNGNANSFSDDDENSSMIEFLCRTEFKRREYEANKKPSMIVGIAGSATAGVAGFLAILFAANPEWFSKAKSESTINITPLAQRDRFGLSFSARF